GRSITRRSSRADIVGGANRVSGLHHQRPLTGPIPGDGWGCRGVTGSGEGCRGEFLFEGELRGFFRGATAPENDGSRKSLTCSYLLSEGDGTRTRNHRIDSRLLCRAWDELLHKPRFTQRLRQLSREDLPIGFATPWRTLVWHHQLRVSCVHGRGVKPMTAT